MTPGEWAMHSHFIKRNVVLWPARFMWGKGFTIPGPRYEAIMRGIFETIKTRGHTEVVKFWPGYLMMCVQTHWRHHWEDYYAEAKSVRSAVDAALLACKPVERPDNTVETLAAAHQVLATRKRHAKTPRLPSHRSPQLGFQGL
jgi:hypothetical protein